MDWISASERARAIEELERNTNEREAKGVQLTAIDDEKRLVEENVAQASGAVSDCAEVAIVWGVCSGELRLAAGRIF